MRQRGKLRIERPVERLNATLDALLRRSRVLCLSTALGTAFVAIGSGLMATRSSGGWTRLLFVVGFAGYMG